MLNYRIIPVLTIDGEKLIKTKQFKKPRYVGDPINAIKIFNDKEVDELIILDITATKNNSEPNFKLIHEMVSECFMPICYGGGIKNIDHAKKIFELGVEKIALNHAALNDSGLITALVKKFGSQSIAVSIDIGRNFLNKISIFDYKKNRLTSVNWLSFVKSIERLGAGEIVLNSITNDGMKTGYDYQAINDASKILNIPLTILGGAGHYDHFVEAVKNGASAVAASSFFIYYGPYDAVLIRYPKI